MGFFSKKPKRIYLDFAAATPVRPEVLRAMKPYFEEVFANPSAVHAEGQKAREAIERARETLARLLRIRETGVIFTGSGTESNNLAIAGTIEALANEGRRYEDMEIITTKIEHPSILETVRALEAKGVVVHYAEVEKESGRVLEASFQKLLGEKTALVTYAYANSEIGVVQDVKKISRLVKKYNAEHGTKIKTHLDASQAPLWLPCQMDMLGVDLMTLDAGKCHGPKGVGVLARLGSAPLRPILYGGGQEGNFRPGTESAALIVGAVAALQIADEGREARVQSVAKLRDQFFALLEKEIPEAIINGSRDHRLPNNVHISIPGFDSEFAAVALDANGIAVSTRSACGAGKGTGSYVVREIAGEDRGRSTLRFTLGETSSMREIEHAAASLKKHLESMRMYKDVSAKT